MTLKGIGVFALNKSWGKAGVVYVPAKLVSDSVFPLRPGKVEIRIEGNRLIICKEGG